MKYSWKESAGNPILKSCKARVNGAVYNAHRAQTYISKSGYGDPIDFLFPVLIIF